MRTRTLAASLILSACLALTTSPAMAQGGGGGYEALMTKQVSTLVHIKFVSKIESEEQEEEIPGVMIEKGGLVLTSNDMFRGLGARFGSPAAQATNIKILIGDDTEGVDAKIIARDSELGLAWVQIDKPAADGYTFVDFASGGAPAAGESLLMISKLSKFFDRAAVVTEGKVACITAKPRKLMIPSLSLAVADWGVPVFDAQARPVGIMTIILPEQDELQNTPGGPGEILKGVQGGKMILPAADIVAATKRAKETAASGASPDAAPKEAPKTDGAKPEAPKADAPKAPAPK